ncbi:MAG TPA: hypothetical protein PKW33_13055 [Anaerolineaceae bacterium]|nr:hypothetical protein [Anaerolineaceae bacterium]HPN52512.1 hypothetical protein [Anaerolineaceae bacterium]
MSEHLPERESTERALYRIQAGDVLTACLEQSSDQPMRKLVESLLAAGTKSLVAMQETMAETQKRRRLVEDDLRQILTALRANLESCGLPIDNQEDLVGLLRYRRSRLQTLMDLHGIEDDNAREECRRLVADAHDLMKTLRARLTILQDIEKYLNDWSWGMMYQSVHQTERPVN